MAQSAQVHLDMTHFKGHSQGENQNLLLMSLVWYLKSTSRNILWPHWRAKRVLYVIYLEPKLWSLLLYPHPGPGHHRLFLVSLNSLLTGDPASTGTPQHPPSISPQSDLLKNLYPAGLLELSVGFPPQAFPRDSSSLMDAHLIKDLCNFLFLLECFSHINLHICWPFLNSEPSSWVTYKRPSLRTCCKPFPQSLSCYHFALL